MSKAKIVKVIDPIFDLSSSARQMFLSLVGADETDYDFVKADSVTNSNAKFNNIKPSRETYIGRKIPVSVPVTLEWAGNPAGDVNKPFLLRGKNAFRAFPISSVTNLLKCKINNETSEIQLYNTIHPLMHYNVSNETLFEDHSISPNLLDNAQRYEEYSKNGVMNNVLGDFIYGLGKRYARGSYPMEVEYNNERDGCKITAILFEYVMLPPMAWGSHLPGGFTHIQTFKLEFDFISNLQRMWSHSTELEVADVTPTVNIGEEMYVYMKKFTRNAALVPRAPDLIQYPYFEVDPRVYNNTAAFAPNQTRTLNSGTYSISSIPERTLIYVGRGETEMANAATCHKQTDSYFRIDAVDLTFDNKKAILSGTESINLYTISQKNGLKSPYIAWNGVTSELGPLVAGGNQVKHGLLGSILALQYGTDVLLKETRSAGVGGHFNFEVKVTCTNINQVETITPDVYMVHIYQGIYTITSNGHSSADVGILTEADVVLSRQDKKAPTASFNAIVDSYGSGNFFSAFHDFSRGLINSAKKVGKHITPVIKKGIQWAIDHPEQVAKGAATVASLAPMLGLGKDASAKEVKDALMKLKRAAAAKKKPARRRARGRGLLTDEDLLNMLD